jgi:sugar-specific transcriptional regulator TrmB
LSEEVVRKLLSSIGLAAGEVNVYTFIAGYSGLTCGQIAKNMKKNRARIYATLKRLETKGMVERTIDPPARFVAVPIEKILDLNIERKRQEASCLEHSRKEAIDFWTNARKKRVISSQERIALIEGYRNIYPKVFRMIRDSRKEFLFLVGDSCLFEGVQIELNRSLLRKALNSNVRIRVLRRFLKKDIGCTENHRKRFSKRIMRGQILERLLEPTFGIHSRFAVADRQEALLFSRISENPHVREGEVCLWTDSRVIIGILTSLFEKLWSTSSEPVAAPSMLIECGYSNKTVEEILKWYK